MLARISTEEKKNTVLEFISDLPENVYTPDLVWISVPSWIEPYINTTYWWDDKKQMFEDGSGYEKLLSQAKDRQYAIFDAAFAALDVRRSRPTSDIVAAQATGMALPQDDVNILSILNAIAKENREKRDSIAGIVLPVDVSDESMTDMLSSLSAIMPRPLP